MLRNRCVVPGVGLWNEAPAGLVGLSLVGLMLLGLAVDRAGAAEDAGEEGTTVLHVTPGGEDGNPGTSEKPLGTLHGARDAVRQRIADGLGRDIRVIIHEGRYRITEPLSFGPKDSGTAEHSITYAAAEGERPLITGGRRITGWEANGDGSWTAPVPDGLRFRELFVNGERRQRARHPNEGYARVVEPSPDKRSGFTFNPEDIPADAGAPGTELVFLHDWSTTRVEVASIDHEAEKLTATHPIGPSADHYKIDHFEPHPRYYLTNDPAFLDAPGEWHHDRENNRLTYHPLDGESIDDVEAVVPVAEKLLQVRGEPGNPVRNLHFVGLRFAHSRWDLPAGGYAAGQACFHEQRHGDGGGNELRRMAPAAVSFRLARGCSFRDGSITHTGSSGIWLGGRTRDCRLVGSHIADVSGNGVMVGEDRSRHVEGRPWWRSAPDQAANGNTVTNNVIERCGRQFFGAVGVWVGITRATRIAHNEIRELPYTGVSVGWMWNPTPTPSRDNVVEYNHIHHMMQTLSDGGGIYTLGRQPGGRLRGNHIHGVPPNAGRAESNGMFLDQGTTELIIERNVIHDVERSPLRFHRAKENLVRRNVLVLAEGVPVVRYNATDPEHITLKDNRTPKQPEWDPASAREMIDRAGLEDEYRRRLLSRP